MGSPDNILKKKLISEMGQCYGSVLGPFVANEDWKKILDLLQTGAEKDNFHKQAEVLFETVAKHLHFSCDEHYSEVSDIAIQEEQNTLLEILLNILKNESDIYPNDIYLFCKKCIADSQRSNDEIQLNTTEGFELLNIGNMPSTRLLHFAAQTNNLQLTQQLLNHNANANICDSWGQTPLLIATRKGYSDICNELISNGNVNLNMADKHGVTPLQCAADVGDLKLVSLLLSTGASVNLNDIHGCSPLHLAARGFNTKVVDILLQSGADINGRDRNGMTPLHEVHSLEITKLLIAKNADVDTITNDGYTPLHYAVKQRHSELVTLLLKYCDPNISTNEGFTPLHLSVILGNEDSYVHKHATHDTVRSIEIAKQMIQHGCFLNCKDKKGKTPLVYAIEENKLDLVPLLLQSGADINLGDPAPLYLACKHGLVSIVNLLLDNKADINAVSQSCDQSTPLDIALDKLVPVNLTNSSAIRLYKRNHGKIVQTLIQNGGHLASMSTSDKELLHFAVENNDCNLASALISAGFDTNRVDYARKTALQLAVKKGNCDIVAILARAPITNLNSPKGNTPMENLLQAWNDSHPKKLPLRFLTMMRILLIHGAVCDDPRALESVVVCSRYGVEKREMLQTAECLFISGYQIPQEEIHHIFDTEMKTGRFYPHEFQMLLSFKDYFENYYQSKNLKQWCRVFLRKMFMIKHEGKSIVNDIETLPLPQPIKDYLSLYQK